MQSLKDTQFWLCYFLFIVPVVKNYLKLCVNQQFIAPSLYNQITQLIFITDRFRPKIKCTTLFGGTLCLCEVMRSDVFCQNFWQITQRLPGNWRGGGKRFSGPSGQALPLPLRVSFSRARFFLCPPLPSACYAGYFHKEKFLRFRNPESLHEAKQTQSNPVTTDTEGAIESVRFRGVSVLSGKASHVI